MVPKPAPQPSGEVDPESEEEDMDEEVEVDEESERDYQHYMLGKQLSVFYDNVWFTGNVSWFNKKMDKVRVAYEDDTDDYISVAEIDGIEVILL